MKSKIRNLVLTLIYGLTFHWVYVIWMEPLFGYLGVAYDGITISRLLFTYLMVLLPNVWLEDTIRRPSQFIYWATYLLTYIPMIFVPLFFGYSEVDFYLYNLTLILGFFLLGSSYFFRLIRFKLIKVDDNLFWFFFLGIVALFCTMIVYYLGSSLQIVNMLDSSEVYAQRLRDDVDRGPVAYPINFLAGVFAPFLFAYGLCYKKRGLLIASILVQLLIFSVGANKVYVLTTFLMIATFAAFKSSYKNVGLKLTLSLSLPMLLIGVVYQFAKTSVTKTFFSFSSLIIFRTIGISTFNMPFYVDFFESNPKTYYTHINIVNKISGAYPYDAPMGRVLGKEYFDAELFNMNANFWLTDGIASIGLIGIPVISLIGAFVFYILDCSSMDHRKVFVVLLCTYAATIIQNVSLFTAIITGGLGFTILLLLIKKGELRV